MYEGVTASVSDTQEVHRTVSSARESPHLLLTHIQCEGVTEQVMRVQRMHYKLKDGLSFIVEAAILFCLIWEKYVKFLGL